MGADIAIQTMRWRTGKTPEATEKNLQRVLKDVKKRIDALEYDAEVYELLDAACEDTPENMESVKERLNDSLDRVTDAAHNELRDAAAFEIVPGWIVLITAGMSWGDAPTDTYEAMSDLETAGVLREDLLWD